MIDYDHDVHLSDWWWLLLFPGPFLLWYSVAVVAGVDVILVRQSSKIVRDRRNRKTNRDIQQEWMLSQ